MRNKNKREEEKIEELRIKISKMGNDIFHLNRFKDITEFTGSPPEYIESEVRCEDEFPFTYFYIFPKGKHEKRLGGWGNITMKGESTVIINGISYEKSADNLWKLQKQSTNKRDI